MPRFHVCLLWKIKSLNANMNWFHWMEKPRNQLSVKKYNTNSSSGYLDTDDPAQILKIDVTAMEVHTCRQNCSKMFPDTHWIIFFFIKKGKKKTVR